MIRKIRTLALATALLGTCALADEAKVSGDFSLYAVDTSNSGTTKDSGYSMSSLNIDVSKALVDSLNANVGFRTNHKINESEDGDYSDGTDPEVAMHTANLTYSKDSITVVAGRQEIDLEWIGDYHEAVVGVVQTIPNTTIILGHTNKFFAADSDGALEEIANINGDNGASVLDISYSVNDTLGFGAYYMNSNDLFSAVGALATAELSGLGVVAKYATTSEDVATTKDGSIFALDLAYSVSGLDLNGGYIVTDKDGAIGSLDTLGDNINPLDDGGQVYATDASTYYVGVAKELGGFSFGLLYGSTDYEDSKSQSELNITLSKELVADTSLDLLYANVSADSSDDDTSYFSAQLTYSF